MSTEKDDEPVPEPIHTLVTGFGPFPGRPTNPSGTLALSFEGNQIGGGFTRGHQIATSWGRSFSGIAQGLEGAQPQVLILLGVAKIKTPKVELIARNHRGARLDCDGVISEAGELMAGGAAQLSTTLPVSGLPPTALSEDAGDYLCNSAFYWTMALFSHIPYRGFIHIPEDNIEGSRAFVLDVLRAIERQA